jgi:Zn-dependent protease
MFEDPVLFILRLPVILIALTFHEYAHGWVAWKLGDNTARNEGRLTLNPISHLDLIGTLMLLAGPFGWAKPVPVNSYYFKNPKRDILLVNLAGPVSNIILAFIFGYTFRFLSFYNPSLIAEVDYLQLFIQLAIMINIGIAFFNMIPIPPLDGSKILIGLLPNKWIPGYIEKSRHLPMIFIVLLLVEWGLKIPVFSTIINPFFVPFNKLILLMIFGKGF